MNWKPAKAAVAAFTKSARECAAHAITAGLHLLKLRAEHAIGAEGGRPKKLPHRAGVFVGWEETVEQQLDISDDTAQRWMRAAREYVRQAKLFGADIQWWNADKDAQRRLFAGIAKLVAGKSIKELAADWQRFMDSGRSDILSFGNGGLDAVPDLSPALELSALRELAHGRFEDAFGTMHALDMAIGDMPAFAVLDKATVERQAAGLRTLLALREAFIRGGDKALRLRRDEEMERIHASDETLAELEGQRVQMETMRKGAWRRAAKQQATSEKAA